MLLRHKSTGRVRFEMFHLEDQTVPCQCDVAELKLKRLGKERFFLSFIELADAREFHEEFQRARVPWWCAVTPTWAGNALALWGCSFALTLD